MPHNLLRQVQFQVKLPTGRAETVRKIAAAHVRGQTAVCVQDCIATSDENWSTIPQAKLVEEVCFLLAVACIGMMTVTATPVAPEPFVEKTNGNIKWTLKVSLRYPETAEKQLLETPVGVLAGIPPLQLATVRDLLVVTLAYSKQEVMRAVLDQVKSMVLPHITISV